MFSKPTAIVGNHLQGRRGIHDLAVNPVGQHADERVLVGDVAKQLVARNRSLARIEIDGVFRFEKTEVPKRGMRASQENACQSLKPNAQSLLQ